MCGEGLVENVIWGRGLAENVRIPSYRGEGSKIAPKTVMIFERSLYGVYVRTRVSCTSVNKGEGVDFF